MTARTRETLQSAVFAVLLGIGLAAAFFHWFTCEVC